MIEILVHAVGAGRGDRHRDAVFGGVVHQVGAALEAIEKLVHAPGSDHLQIGLESIDSQLEADLVVAFAGGPVGNIGGALLLGHFDVGASDAGSGQTGAQQVAALVEGVGLDGREDEVGHELPLQILHEDVDRPRRPGPPATDGSSVRFLVRRWSQDDLIRTKNGDALGSGRSVGSRAWPM